MMCALLFGGTVMTRPYMEDFMENSAREAMSRRRRRRQRRYKAAPSNIIDLTKRRKLHPIKIWKKSTLYLKSEALK